MALIGGPNSGRYKFIKFRNNRTHGGAILGAAALGGESLQHSRADGWGIVK